MTEETGGARALSLWPPSFDAAIFDFDGTLADSMGIWEEVDRRFLASRNIPYTDDLAREIPALGTPDASRVRTYRSAPGRRRARAR